MFTVVPGRVQATLSIDLMCNLFGAILSDVANVPVERLESIHVTLEYWTPASQCYFESIYRHFQYLLVGLVLKLEYDYPFVFSFYGKHLIKINYRNLIRVHEELTSPLPNLKASQVFSSASPNSTTDEVEVPNSQLPLHPLTTSVGASQQVLLKLHKHILHEFNTLNVMKECDLSSHQRNQCKRSWTKPNSSSLKRLVFAPSILEDLHLA